MRKFQTASKQDKVIFAYFDRAFESLKSARVNQNGNIKGKYNEEISEQVESVVADCEAILRELREPDEIESVKKYQGTVNGTPTGQDRKTISEASNDARLAASPGDMIAVIDSETLAIVQPGSRI